jgi:hypothetical protein
MNLWVDHLNTCRKAVKYRCKSGGAACWWPDGSDDVFSNNQHYYSVLPAGTLPSLGRAQRARPIDWLEANFCERLVPILEADGAPETKDRR